MNDDNSEHEYDECSFIRDDSLKQVRGLFDEEVVFEVEELEEDDLDKDYLPLAELIAQMLQEEYKITYVDLLKAFLSATDEEYQQDVSMMIAEGKVGGKICAIKRDLLKK